MSTKPTTRKLDSDFVGIEAPITGRHHAVPAVGITIEGVAGEDVTKVWLKILRNGDSIPSDPSTAPGWVEAPVAGESFRKDNVSGTLTTPLDGNSNNRAVAVAHNLPDSEPADVPFVGRPVEETNIQVSAKACIWFTFAPDGLTGPGPEDDCEDDTANHRPKKIILPANAVKMTVSATGTWRHYPTNADCNADGWADRVTDLENKDYKNTPGYNSGSITDIETNAGKLIGLWVDANGDPVAEGGVTNPFPIGQNLVNQTIPDTAHTLYLAFHDGNRWHNNSGSVTVTITWSLAASFSTFRKS